MKGKSKKADKQVSLKINASKPLIPDTRLEPKTLAMFLKKSAVILFVVFIIVILLDFKGLFDSSEINYHSKRAWDEFYTFTKDKEIDVLLIGNSHVYTGINPQSFSTSLGVNSFILSAPGTHLGDVYFSFKEALKRAKPKVVVVETYSMNDFDPYNLEGSALSDQFKSFASRKNIGVKLMSTPMLFSLENYLFAWSSLFRNHSLIFKDPAQIASNFEKKRTIVPALGEDFKLGKFVRFISGLEPAVINKYDEFGAPVKGQDYTYSKYTVKYLEKIKKLAYQNNIKLVFLTLPMYKRHIENYELWKLKLNDIIDSKVYPWLDLQDRYDEFRFDETSFENTYEANQHMTYIGSVAASYALASFIRNDLKITLPQRFSESKWLEVFYGKDSYFENCPVLNNDAFGKSLAKYVKFSTIPVKEVIAYKRHGNNALLVKINKSEFDLSVLANKKLMITANALVNGVGGLYNIEIFNDPAWNPLDHHLFFHFSKDLEVVEVLDVFLTN